MKKKTIKNIFLYSTFIVFTILTLFFAFKFKMGVSPDSYYHYEVSKAYSTTLGIPLNTPETYEWRDITRIPYLYFWINGRILNINNGYINEILLLRFFNVVYSLLTVIVTYLLSKEIFNKRRYAILPVFLLTNTLMFLFLSSSINYDNLANLFAVLGIYFFVKLLKNDLDLKYLLIMLIFLSLGTLTKFTILPLAFILVILSTIHILRKRKEIFWNDIKKYIPLLILLFLILLLNANIYILNIFKYGSLEPECNQILTHEQCLTNGVYYRDIVTIPAQKIDGIKGIFELITNGERENPLTYSIYWLANITSKIFGIMGDSSFNIPYVLVGIYLVYLIIGLLFGIKYRKRFNTLDMNIIIVFFFYIFVLFFFQNYNMYLKHNHMFLALQGRYIFPVISLGYIIYIRSISFVKNTYLKRTILFSLLLIFVFTIFYFILNIPDFWFELNF